MTDIILHLWRGSQEHNSSPQFQFSDQDAVRPLIEEEFFAPRNGTMERFRARVHFNTATANVTITFLRNGLIQRTIGPILVGQTGLFLPSLQLPLTFDKDDLLVMQIIGATFPGSFQMELNCDLRLNE